ERGTVKEPLDLNLKVARARVELDAKDPENCRHLGAALCLSGDNWEGVKWYRRAKKLGLQEDITGNLIMPQLQWPGMVFDGLCVLTVNDGNTFHCVAREDEFKMKVNHPFDTMSPIDESVDIIEIKYKKPSDPDDPEVFGELLAKLHADMEEEDAQAG
ncbi:MAG: hypothetical protein SGILL_005446, partial [Bacillariaceae sp.]